MIKYIGSFKYMVTDLETRKQLITDGIDPSSMNYEDTYINDNGYSSDYMMEYIESDLKSMARWLTDNIGILAYEFKIKEI